MVKRLLIVCLIALPIIQVSGQEKARPNRQEIINLMVQGRQMAAADREGALANWQDPAASKAIRADFMKCTGLAYLGNYKAQAYVAASYEKAIGIVEDQLESYVWYAIAHENAGADKAAKEKIQASRARVYEKLHSVYPAPSDEDLEDLVKAQKNRIAQYQEEANKTK